MIEIKQTATFQKWQHKLKDHRAKALIAARIFRLANGLSGDVKPVGQGVSELRIHYGQGYRVYFQQRGNEIILLLCGGVKRSQQKDIETALKLAEEWRSS
ncbi:MAG: type II toxin-antitoxin system RelE/ParE family toxin [Desulforegulaceae bacterium]|nr:type II toxin-antitoxin system RelE/ParE family toxin [Desulforegulaceae bacterium]